MTFQLASWSREDSADHAALQAVPSLATVSTTTGATEATADGGKRRADGNADGGPQRRSKKGKKGRRNGGGSSASGSVPAEPQPQELVAVSPLAPNAEILQVRKAGKTG